jgi:hypothetical protein
MASETSDEARMENKHKKLTKNEQILASLISVLHWQRSINSFSP